MAPAVLPTCFRFIKTVTAPSHGATARPTDEELQGSISRTGADHSVGGAQLMEARAEPRLVLVFSGKRKSGKDYVTELIQSRYNAPSGSIRESMNQ